MTRIVPHTNGSGQRKLWIGLGICVAVFIVVPML